MDDELEWPLFDLLLDDRLDIAEDDGSASWPEFLDEHATLVRETPAEMLRTVRSLLRPLWEGVGRHLPFLRAIQADPVDEANLLIYADWLEERSDGRAEFLRLYCRYLFHDDRSSSVTLVDSLAAQPGGWLHQVMGNADRAQDFRRRIAAR
jgi:uncharacterized protein (TIGR02996 family)